MTITMIHSCIIYRCTSSYDGIRHTSADETDTASCVEVYTFLAVIALLRNCEMKDSHALTPISATDILVSFLRALLYWIRYVSL
mmetsp:Transcript_37062/g.75574  ORF Transcript_37062/g.75574 Transcript_37062/m.75574 type:complete len:84 (+) Transcript_37062:237-488(+)